MRVSMLFVAAAGLAAGVSVAQGAATFSPEFVGRSLGADAYWGPPPQVYSQQNFGTGPWNVSGSSVADEDGRVFAVANASQNSDLPAAGGNSATFSGSAAGDIQSPAAISATAYSTADYRFSVTENTSWSLLGNFAHTGGDVGGTVQNVPYGVQVRLVEWVDFFTQIPIFDTGVSTYNSGNINESGMFEVGKTYLLTVQMAARANQQWGDSTASANVTLSIPTPGAAAALGLGALGALRRRRR